MTDTSNDPWDRLDSAMDLTPKSFLEHNPMMMPQTVVTIIEAVETDNPADGATTFFVMSAGCSVSHALGMFILKTQDLKEVWSSLKDDGR